MFARTYFTVHSVHNFFIFLVFMNIIVAFFCDIFYFSKFVSVALFQIIFYIFI